MWNSNPWLWLVVPLAGFLAGLMLWSRLTHWAIAIFGLWPDRSKPPLDVPTAVKKVQRLVWLMSSGWVIVFGTLVGFELYTARTGWALFFGATLAVPLLMATTILKTMRKTSKLIQQRAAAPQPPTS